MSPTLGTLMMVGIGQWVALLLLSASLDYRNTRPLNDQASGLPTPEMLNLTCGVMLASSPRKRAGASSDRLQSRRYKWTPLIGMASNGLDAVARLALKGDLDPSRRRG